MITQDEVRRIFVYEEDGRLRRVAGGRKPYPWRRGGSGKRYLLCTLPCGTYYAHRLVWVYHHGYHPVMLDHVNGNTEDNRIENLRECTTAQNNYNSRRKSNNRSGFKGVTYTPRMRLKWCAKIGVAGSTVALGQFGTPEEAAAAYAKGAARYAAEFARQD